MRRALLVAALLTFPACAETPTTPEPEGGTLEILFPIQSKSAGPAGFFFYSAAGRCEVTVEVFDRYDLGAHYACDWER